MPVKVVPPVLITQKSLSSKQNIGPITVMSGFMSKKGRTLNRWKQRWWQLLDNGYLFYFKSDDRLRILGQIDIARTCYDVRLGSGKCRVAFPRAAPSCCCISFAVLKRNYYVYTPTAGEAEKWAQSLSDMSQVINRRVYAGVEHRKAPDPPGPPSRPPSCPPNFHVQVTRVRATKSGQGKSDSYEDFTRIEYVRNNTNLVSRRAMAVSVPDSLDKIADDYAPLGQGESLDSRLWLDGSPPAPNGVVHPHSEHQTADISWGTPERHLSSPLPRERLLSLPTTVVVDYEPLNDQETDDIVELDHYIPSITSNGGSLSPSEETQPLAYSKGLSRSLDSLQSCTVDPHTETHTPIRPIPKPRKPRAHTNPEVMFTVSTEDNLAPASLHLLPEMRPRNNSEPPRIRPRKGSGAPSDKNLAPHRSSKNGHRSSKNKRRSRKLSPPSTPPPPPPAVPTQDSELPSMLNKPTGPPKFIPPPPPLGDQEE